MTMTEKQTAAAGDGGGPAAPADRATTRNLLACGVLGLVWGGVFVVDPSLGYPPGTPPGIPDQQSWHSALHTVAPVAASLAVGAAGLVFAGRFAGLGQWGWATYSVASAVVGFALTDHVPL
jgi:hypothetical protein